MKKLATLLFTFIYLTASVGILLNVHYCGGKVSGVNMVWGSAKCACGENSGKASCCKNEHKLLKINDVHKGFLAAGIQQLFKQAAVYKNNISFLAVEKCDNTAFFNNTSAPPDMGGPLYQRYCVYRI